MRAVAASQRVDPRVALQKRTAFASLELGSASSSRRLLFWLDSRLFFIVST